MCYFSVRHLNLLLLALLLGACGAPSAASPPSATPAPAALGDGRPVVITFGVDEFSRATYEPLAARFNAENPDVHVQLVVPEGILTPPQPGVSRARQLAVAADTFVTPELGEPEAVRRGYLRDLAPFIVGDAGFDREDYFPDAIQADTDGAVALLPAELHLPLLAYNRALWAERGLAPPRPDWSWSDLRAVAERLATRSRDGVDVYGLMQSKPLTMLQNPELTGEPIVAELLAGRRLDDPETAAALERVAELFRAGVLFAPPEYLDGTSLHTSDYMPLLEGGRIGIWMAQDGERPFGEPLPFAIGYAPPPVSEIPFLQVQRRGYAMSAGTRHPDAAWRWLAFLSAQPTVDAHAGLTVLPARPSLAEAGGRWDALGPEGRAAAEAALARMSGQGPAEGGGPPRTETALLAALSQAFNAILSERMPAAHALRQAQAELDAAQTAAAPPPTPEPAPVVVATARLLVPAPRITFVTDVGFDRPTREAAERFNAQFPEYAVALRTLPIPHEGTVGLADLAAAGDCFGGFVPPTSPAERALLLDLQPLADADATFSREAYQPALLELFRHEGGLYGLPDRVIPRLLFYNRDLFDAAGLAYPDASWTIDDLAAAAQTLTGGESGVRQYGFAALSASDLLFFLERTGASPFRAGGTPSAPEFTSAAVRSATEAYLGLLRAAAPVAPPADYARGGGETEAYQLVMEGHVAMWLGFGFDAAASGEASPFTVGVAPIPLGERPLGLADLTIEGLFISARTTNPEACWAWLRFLSAEPGRFQHTLPALASLAKSPTVQAQAPADAAEAYGAYCTALGAGVIHNTLSAHAGAMSYWLLRAADQAMEGADLPTELADAQFFAEQYLSCVGGGERGAVCVRQVDPRYDGWQ